MKKSLFITSVVIIVLAILVIAGVFAIYNHFFPKAIEPSKYVQVQADTNLDNWKVAIDKTFGYEIKYPPNWTSKEIFNDVANLILFRPVDKSNDLINDYVDMSNYVLSSKDCSMPFLDFVKSGSSGFSNSTLISLKKLDAINNVEAYEITWKVPASYGETYSPEHTSVETYFRYSGQDCKYTTAVLYDNHYFDIYNKIISTFKFTK